MPTAQVYRSVGELSSSPWQTRQPLKSYLPPTDPPEGKSPSRRVLEVFSTGGNSTSRNWGSSVSADLRCVPHVDGCQIASLHNRRNVFLFCNFSASGKKNITNKTQQIEQVRVCIRQHLGSSVKLGEYPQNSHIAWP